MKLSRAQLYRLFVDISKEFPMEDYYHVQYFPSSLSRYIDILTWVPRVSSGRALDVGCGYADISVALDKLGYSVFATDLFSRPVEERIHKYNITFQKHNIEAEPLPFEDSWFDLVIFSEVLEHLNYSPLSPLQEICRVLKREGKLILTTPNIASLKRIITLMLGRNSVFMDLKRYYITPKPFVRQDNQPFFDRHIRLYTTSELKQLIEVARFRVDEVHYSYQPGALKQARWKKAIHFCLAAALRLTSIPLLGDNIIVIATKNYIEES